MDVEQRQQQYSFAYVRAVASVAGFAAHVPEVDDDSIDMGLGARGGYGTLRSPKVDLQIKCTSNQIWHKDPMRFALKKKNYTDLRGDDFLVPRLLIVVCVPKALTEWIEQNEERLIMRRCGYFLSLRAHPPRLDISANVTVSIPKNQMFTVEALHVIMDKIANREPL